MAYSHRIQFTERPFLSEDTTVHGAQRGIGTLGNGTTIFRFIYIH